jgi:putative protease
MLEGSNSTWLGTIMAQAHKARDFYAKHGVRVIAAAYESHEEAGEVSLMITKHCVRYSLSRCPKQAKGVIGVQGTLRAAPLSLMNGSEKLTLRFDRKACEIHVVGKLKPAVVKNSVTPLSYYKTRPQVCVCAPIRRVTAGFWPAWP